MLRMRFYLTRPQLNSGVSPQGSVGARINRGSRRYVELLRSSE